MPKRVHARIDWHGRTVIFRDLGTADLSRIADYWLHTDWDFFRSMGVHVEALGDRQALVTRFADAIPTGNADQAKLGFAIEVDDAMVGYSTLNRYAPAENYSHWHIVDPAWRRGGLSSLLYPYRLRTYFGLTGIERLIHQTRPENVGVNRLLDRFVPVAETRHVDRPDGMARAGTFHIRYVHRTDLPRILNLAEVSED